MINRPRFALLLVVLLAAVPARAADKGKFKLFFNSTPDSTDAKDVLLVRPNQTQDYYVFVQNSSDKAEEVTVDLLADGKPVEGGSVIFTANANGFTLVPLGKPPAEKAAAPPAAAPPAAEKAAPPPLVEVKGALKFVLHGKDAAGKRVDLWDVAPVFAKPADYVKVTGYYDLKEKPGVKNQLVLKASALPNFQGGKCRVDVVLNPDRIPGFIDVPKKEGTRGGYLQRPGDEITLTANNLQFRDTGERPDEQKQGTVYVTIDGYERAFIFKSTFPRGGVTESDLDRVSIPTARLKAAPSADPAKPYPVAVELDNAAPESVVEISLDRDGDGKFSKKGGEVLTLGSGSRRQQVFFNPAFPGGALQLKALVTDWGTNLEVAEIFGPRLVRFRLLTDEAEAKKDNDPDKKLVEILDGATDKKAFDITETVYFDGTKPENLKFVDFPKTLPRGAALPVKATAADPESGIKEAVFYVGKPGPDGKPPATAVLVPGKLDDPKTGVWVAKLDAPTEQKGKAEVTAQFTNGAGLVATETVVIQLVDVPPGGAPVAGKASIAGKVFVGARPQPGVPVQLRDAAGGVLDTSATNDKGEFLFKDLAPATYRVYSAKSGDNTKGETVVGVKAGEDKKDVAVNLLR